MKPQSPTAFALLLIALVIAFGVSGCGKNQEQSAGKITLKVAAAADLKFAMDTLIHHFLETHSGIEINPTYGSSGNFYAQVMNGAPFDLYFSADVKYPEGLKSKGLALDDHVFTYAIGRLVVWVPQRSGIDPSRDGIQSLLDPAVKKIAIANPDHAPYGVAAVAAMKTLGVYEQAKPKFVLGENIGQTAQFIESGSADIGIIALALALAPQMADKGKYWEIPTPSFPEMLQGGMILKSTFHREAAKTFRDYILGTEGRRILKKYGFYLPEPNP